VATWSEVLVQCFIFPPLLAATVEWCSCFAFALLATAQPKLGVGCAPVEPSSAWHDLYLFLRKKANFGYNWKPCKKIGSIRRCILVPASWQFDLVNEAAKVLELSHPWQIGAHLFGPDLAILRSSIPRGWSLHHCWHQSLKEPFGYSNELWKNPILTLCTHKGLSRILSFYFRGLNAGFRETTATTTSFADLSRWKGNRVIVDMILGPLKPSARWCFVAAKLDFGSCLLGSTATFR